MSIRPLPPHVAHQIKSSVLITSLNGVICELVKNSLDAEATRITISIDYSRGNCWVEDNGLGILPSEFRQDGGLGKLHHTSKQNSPRDCHGARGDFLACLAGLSLLTLTSCHRQSRSQNSLTIHESKIIARHMPALDEQRMLAHRHGTRVTVRDLFGSMPVRVKHRAGADRQSIEKEWNRLSHDIVGLLLAWRYPVSVVIRDTQSRCEIRFRAGDNATSTRSDAGSTSNSLTSRVSKLLAQAMLSGPIDTGSWETVSASAGPVKAKGCISLNPAVTRRSQFISLGIRPIPNELGSNVLYEEVNRIFNASDFALELEANPLTRLNARNKSGFSGEGNSKEPKARKGVERWPMFYLNITLQTDVDSQGWDVDHVLHQQPTLTAIVKLLTAMCHEFLKKHHFRPLSARKYEGGIPGNPPEAVNGASQGIPLELSQRDARDRQVSTDSLQPHRGSPFDTWHRVKLGQSGPSGLWKRDQKGHGPPGTGSSSDFPLKAPATDPSSSRPPPPRPLLGRTGELLREPFGQPPAISTQMTVTKGTNLSHVESVGASEEVISHSPQIRPASQSDRGERQLASSATSAQRAPSDPTLGASGGTRSANAIDKRPSQWLDDLLKSWENPVFETTERPIKSAKRDFITGTLDTKLFGNGMGGDSMAASDVSFESLSISHHERLSRSSLTTATVINQVDKKYILAQVVPDSVKPTSAKAGGSSLLVMVDQHAADERCRLEQLMRDYFRFVGEGRQPVAVTGLLNRAMQFDLSGTETALLRRFQAHIEYWGIFFRTSPVEMPSGDMAKQIHKVQVFRLPASILGRCQEEPRLLIELLRNEIWRLDEGGSAPSVGRPIHRVQEAAASKDWVSLFHGCPQGILDLLNSRACRSAIMFNDALTIEECSGLLGRLATCAFPFQCAHGRPSIVPLLAFGDGQNLWGWKEMDHVGAGAWKDYMRE